MQCYDTLLMSDMVSTAMVVEMRINRVQRVHSFTAHVCTAGMPATLATLKPPASCDPLVRMFAYDGFMPRLLASVSARSVEAR